MNLTLVNAPPPGAPPSAEEPATNAVDLMRARRVTAERRLAEATAARKAASESPDALLEAEKIALADAERKAALEEHEAAADAIYRAACVQYGSDRVARIPTRAGSIVMRPQSEPEGDAHDERIAAFARRKDAAKTTAEADDLQRSAEQVARLGIRSTILSPLDHFDRVTALHFRLWGMLDACRRDLTSARVLAEGKDAAP